MKYRALSEVSTITMGQSPDSSSYNERKEGLPFFQGNADFGEIHPQVRVWCAEPKKTAQKDDILISVRAPIGALNIADRQCCIGRGLASVRVNESLCDRKFLWYALKSKVEELISKGTGSTFKAIGKNVLMSIAIPDIELKDQSTISNKLDIITILINRSKKQLENLDELVKSRFVEMFGDISYSNKFQYKKVQEFTGVVSGGTPNRDNNDYWENGKIPWVKTTELKHAVIEKTEEYITDKGLAESSAKIVPENTIVIAMYGQGKTRGMTGLLKIKASTNQACACVLPSDNVNHIYLWKFFELSYDNLRDLAKGGNQPNLNGNMIKNYPVLFPPRSLQNQFADFVTKVEKQKTTVQKSIDKLETLKKSLMQKFFG